MNYYTRHIGDYLKDTSHLSLLEHGVYTRLLDVYYNREKPFADAAEACKLIGARTAPERVTVSRVLAEYFAAAADGWRQKRCDEEVEKYQEKVAINRAVGGQGGRPKKTVTVPENNHDGSGAETMTVQNGNPPNPNTQEPIANSQEKTKAKAVAVAPPDWLDAAAWASFLEFRKEKKAAMSPTAQKLCIAELDRLRAAGCEPVAVINQSIVNGWKGVFELKNRSQPQIPKAPHVPRPTVEAA